MHYPPVHRFASYRESGDALPRTDAIADRELTLPFYPALPDAHVQLVVEALLESLS
ncbi:MAG: DegT/DnrJ/EryC1/StrS family aminotransferase [Actinobacteria bacterium]|nr:DegT/DnrJ/EryC1/StrS family aminotransferase [Actinomycetota bacterium]